MALTPEQQAQIDFQAAMSTVQNAGNKELEQIRYDNTILIEARRAKLEAIRLAKETLIENARSKPADAREITAADITAFAAALEAHINA